jgi:serine/threonine protein kinase
MRKDSVHVATQDYKSPELLMYSESSMDMWSVVVMLLEILSHKLHIFDVGDNGGRVMISWADTYHVT